MPTAVECRGRPQLHGKCSLLAPGWGGSMSLSSRAVVRGRSQSVASGVLWRLCLQNVSGCPLGCIGAGYFRPATSAVTLGTASGQGHNGNPFGSIALQGVVGFCPR